MLTFAQLNLKLFFRDKSAVFFSLLAVFIIIGLYALFLGDVWTDSLSDLANARQLMDSWIMAGLLAVTSITTTMGAFGVMVDDRSKKIDKDFASELLAEELNADFLIILTAVEKVAINFGKPEEKWLDNLTPDQAKVYMEEGHFAPGSMLPKVQAAVKFAESKDGRTALITLLEKAKEGIQGLTGTQIHQ